MMKEVANQCDSQQALQSTFTSTLGGIAIWNNVLVNDVSRPYNKIKHALLKLINTVGKLKALIMQKNGLISHASIRVSLDFANVFHVFLIHAADALMSKMDQFVGTEMKSNFEHFLRSNNAVEKALMQLLRDPLQELMTDDDGIDADYAPSTNSNVDFTSVSVPPMSVSMPSVPPIEVCKVRKTSSGSNSSSNNSKSPNPSANASVSVASAGAGVPYSVASSAASVSSSSSNANANKVTKKGSSLAKMSPDTIRKLINGF